MPIQTLNYPSNYALSTIEQTLVGDMLKDDPVLGDIMGVETVDASTVQWEQEDINYGLMQARAPGEPPKSVTMPGFASYVMNPSYFGEFVPIGEQQLTEMRQFGTFNQPVDISKLVYKAMDKLRYRRLALMCKMGWDLIITGDYKAYNADKALVGQLSYTPRYYTAPVPWTDLANSKPLNDLREVKKMKRGYSLIIDGRSKIYLNSTTLQAVQNNINQADLGGRRTTGLTTLNSVESINNYTKTDNLPQFVEYDGYWNYDSNNANYNLFIPDGYAVVVGNRPSGVKLADWQITRNVNTPNMQPGPYAFVYDSLMDSKKPPRSIEVHHGVNMGIAMKYPYGYVVMKVF